MTASSVGSVACDHICDRLQLLMFFIGFKVAWMSAEYGAGPLGAIVIGMAAAVFLPLIVLAALDPWFGTFRCKEKHD